MSTTPRTGRSSARFVARATSHVRPAWWGVLFLGLVTVYITTQASAYHVYNFDLFLFACMGAISLQVLQGTAGLVSLGNPAFMLIGAFGAVMMMKQGAPFPLDVVGAALMAGVAGLIAGIPALRLRALFLALSTLALYFVTVFLADEYLARFPVESQTGFLVKILYTDGGLLSQNRRWAWLLFAIVALVILGASRVMDERSGRALRMMRDHEHLAPTLGISTPWYKLSIFTITSIVIGLQGALLAHFIGVVSTANFTLALAFAYIAMIVIGGLDSVAGAVIGAAIVTALPVLLPTFISPMVGPTSASSYGPNVSLIVYGLLVIVAVTSSPEGVVGFLRSLWRRFGERNADEEDSSPDTPTPVTQAT